MIATRNLNQYVLLHQQRDYGRTGIKMARIIEPWVQEARPRSILDYGAGRGGLVHQLEAPGCDVRHEYDPAIAELNTIPLPAYDLVLCTDVLEHLDEDEIASVLADIRRLSEKAILIVGTAKARARLPSGENAHATVRPASWWLEKMRAQFPSIERIPVLRRNRVGAKTWRTPLLRSIAVRSNILAGHALRKLKRNGTG